MFSTVLILNKSWQHLIQFLHVFSPIKYCAPVEIESLDFSTCPLQDQTLFRPLVRNAGSFRVCVLNIVSDVLHPRVAFDARFDYFDGTFSHPTTHVAVCNAISSVTLCCGNHSVRVHSCPVIPFNHCYSDLDHESIIATLTNRGVCFPVCVCLCHLCVCLSDRDGFCVYNLSHRVSNSRTSKRNSYMLQSFRIISVIV